MTENKTGDLAQNLPESTADKKPLVLTQQISDTCFKTVLTKIVAPMQSPNPRS